MVDPLGEHALGLAREALDRQVELAAEPPGRLLARRADRRVELLCRPPRRNASPRARRARELLELPVLDVAELRLRSAATRLGLLAVDLLLQLALAHRSRSASSWSALAALGRVLLEVRRRLLRHLLRGAIELRRAASRSARDVRRAALQPLGVLADLRLDLGRKLPLALADALELVGEALLQLLEVGAPVGEPLLDRALGRR